MLENSDMWTLHSRFQRSCTCASRKRERQQYTVLQRLSAPSIWWAVLVLAVFGCSSQSATFTSEGSIADFGFFSYPRYRVTFPAFDAQNEPRKSLMFTGAPASQMTFGLVITNVAGRVGIARPSLVEEWGPSVLDVTIESASGAPVAQVRATVREWVLAQSVDRLKLWHPKLRGLPFTQSDRYRITIDISELNPKAGRLVLQPGLEGGGNELP